MKMELYKKFSIDDIKVKYKFSLLYVLGVLLPLVVTNFIFYNNIHATAINQQVTALEESLERTKINIDASINSNMKIADIIASDKTLNALLEKNYKDSEEYLDTYNNYLSNSIVKFIMLYKQVNNINIYVKNPTITSGNSFLYLDDIIESSEWYKHSKISSYNMFIETYFDNNVLQTKSSGRNFSIIRNFNNFPYDSTIEKILKLDIDYDSINQILKDHNLNGDVFIVNDKNMIIFSNSAKFSSKFNDFISFDNYKISKNALQVTKDMDGLLSGWKIIAISSQDDFVTAVRHSKKYIFMLSIINLIIPSLIIFLIVRSLIDRLDIISRHMKRVKQEEFSLVECKEGKDEIGELIREFNRMTLKIKLLIEDVYKSSIQKQGLEIARKQAELNALQSQINPHFLFNILETIRMRSLLKNEKETAEIIKYLSKMFRRSLHWGDDLVSISDELTFTEDFLKIQKYRFEDKLKYNIQADEDIKQCKIPKLTIMTFVENACVHGIESIEKDGVITIKISREGDFVNIVITDNGIGIRKDKLHSIIDMLKTRKLNDGTLSGSESIGIKNVVMRLQMFFEDKFHIDLESKEKEGTTVRFKIPYNNFQA